MPATGTQNQEPDVPTYIFTDDISPALSVKGLLPDAAFLT